MFHPIYNQDGSVAVFRVLCLIIVAFCMMAYAVILLEKNSGGPEEEGTQLRSGAPAAAAGAEEEKAKEEQARKKAAESRKQKEALRLEQVRNTALAELESGVHFLESCGAVNPGFEGCSLSFSETVTGNYRIRSEAADDGFFIQMEARSGQLKDKCRSFFVDSSGVYRATGSEGGDAPECLPQSFMAGLSEEVPSFARATDQLQGFEAPSGLQPLSRKLELHTSSNRHPDDSRYAPASPPADAPARVL